MSLIAVIPYHTKDAALAKQLLQWIQELDGTLPNFSCILAADHQVPREVVLELTTIARTIFRFGETMIIRVPDDHQSWPKGPNWMFYEVSGQIGQRCRLPFLWLEPDCVPLKKGWLQALSEDYAICPKRFMGPIIPGTTPGMPARHMAGVAIYPPDCQSVMKDACKGDQAFDVASAHTIVESYRCCNTSLIYHLWGTHTTAPSFVEHKGPESPENTVSIDVIPPKAVLMHRCKDGSLTALLRARMANDKAPMEAPVITEKRRGRPPKPKPELVTT